MTRAHLRETALCALAVVVAAWPIGTLLRDSSWTGPTLLVVALVALIGAGLRSLRVPAWDWPRRATDSSSAMPGNHTAPGRRPQTHGRTADTASSAWAAPDTPRHDLTRPGPAACGRSVPPGRTGLETLAGTAARSAVCGRFAGRTDAHGPHRVCGGRAVVVAGAGFEPATSGL